MKFGQQHYVPMMNLCQKKSPKKDQDFTMNFVDSNQERMNLKFGKNLDPMSSWKDLQKGSP